MQAKNVLYAAVGAPVVAARKVSDTVGNMRTKMNEEAGDYTKIATKTVEDWAKEGEKLVSRVADNEKVDWLHRHGLAQSGSGRIREALQRLAREQRLLAASAAPLRRSAPPRRRPRASRTPSST